MKRNGKFISICIGILLVGSVFFGFNKEDDRNFQIIKSLDVFNSVFKELDMFYVDSIDPKGKNLVYKSHRIFCFVPIHRVCKHAPCSAKSLLSACYALDAFIATKLSLLVHTASSIK